MEMHPSQRLFKTLHHEGKQKNTLETINPFTLEINGNKPQYYQFVIEAPLKSQGKQYRYVAEISHIIIDSSARAYPSYFKPEQLKNTQLITSGFYPTKEMNAWEKWAQKNGRLIWKIDTQGFYSFKKDPAP